MTSPCSVRPARWRAKTREEEGAVLATCRAFALQPVPRGADRARARAAGQADLRVCQQAGGGQAPQPVMPALFLKAAYVTRREFLLLHVYERPWVRHW